jgi:hypothetical protein
MGYLVHITRRHDWEDAVGEEIALHEWLGVIAHDRELRHDGKSHQALSDGTLVETHNEGLAVWTAWSHHGRDGQMAIFDHHRGELVVNNPDDEVIGKMWKIAKQLRAHVQGDNGEYYGANAQPISESAATGEKPWWKLW